MKKYPTIALGTWSWGVGAAGGDQVFGNNLTAEELKPVFDEAMKCGLNLWIQLPCMEWEHQKIFSAHSLANTHVKMLLSLLSLLPKSQECTVIQWSRCVMLH